MISITRTLTSFVACEYIRENTDHLLISVLSDNKARENNELWKWTAHSPNMQYAFRILLKMCSIV